MNVDAIRAARRLRHEGLTGPDKEKTLCTEVQSAFEFGGTSGGRTHDKRIKSPLLYQLSYGPCAVEQRTTARLRL
ncbi:MAG: hypothetical protein RLZZ280_1363 [Pseudomonadota bacterium]